MATRPSGFSVNAVLEGLSSDWRRSLALLSTSAADATGLWLGLAACERGGGWLVAPELLGRCEGLAAAALSQRSAEGGGTAQVQAGDELEPRGAGAVGHCGQAEGGGEVLGARR